VTVASKPAPYTLARVTCNGSSWKVDFSTGRLGDRVTMARRHI
jgi:hypothetical protein